MCGIAGLTGRNRREPAERMVRAMGHRGPDDCGLHVEPNLALGMTRLSVIDVSSAGHQPMATDDGSAWIVYNGETFNYRDERRCLEAYGHTFRSHADTEVVLHLYRQDGVGFLKRLRGMFALAIWDARERTLLLARDRLGIKPLYYSLLPGGDLLFASELKAMLASGLVPAEPDRRGLRSLLAYGSVAAPGTVLKGVRAFPPGHFLQFRDGNVSIERYWDLPSQVQVTPPVFDDAVAELRTRLREAVRLSLESDVRLGVFLSGGVDSAAILAMMADLGCSDVSAYCVGFHDTDPLAANEIRDARLTADYYGARFHGLEITGEDIDRMFDRFVWALDQPSVDGLNTYLVAQIAGKDVKVALSGLGGDELFGGYGRTAQSFWRSRGFQGAVGRALLKGWRLVNGPRTLSRNDWRTRVDHRLAMSDAFEAYVSTRRVFDDLEINALLGEPDGEAGPGLHEFDTAGSADAVLRTGVLDLRTFVAFQLLRDMDAVAMAHSLEVRFPLLDHELVSWSLSLPAAYKYAPQRRPRTYGEDEFTYEHSGAKRVLFAALNGMLPPDLPKRRKQGFKLPIATWLHGALRARVDAALDGDQLSLLDPLACDQLRAAFRAGRASWPQVWLLLVLSSWERAVLHSAEVAGTAACAVSTS